MIMPLVTVGSISGGGFPPPPSTPPVAEFSYEPYVLNGHSTQFFDASTNNPTSWLWKINGTVFSNAQNPTYYFPYNGTFAILLQATNSFGFSSVTHIVHVVSTLP